MGNLIAFITKYSYVLLFLILQFICFRLLVNSSKKHKDIYINTSKKVIGGVLESKTKVTDYLYLKEVNDSLQRENARLKSLLYQEVKDIPFKDSTGEVIFYVKDSVKKTNRYKYYSAKVLDITFDQKDNYITLSRGSYHGIKKGMAVLSDIGIAGQIVATSSHYSVAKAIISSKFRISAQLKDGTIGYISWPDVDSRFVVLNDISGSINVKHGDTVYTSGYSLFPPRVAIGRIAGIKSSNELTSYKVFLNTNFRRMHYAYIVEDIEEEELTAVLDSAKALNKPTNNKNK